VFRNRQRRILVLGKAAVDITEWHEYKRDDKQAEQELQIALRRAAVDITEWHEYMQDKYAEQERQYRRYHLVRILIVCGAVLVMFLNVFLLAYIRYAGK